MVPGVTSNFAFKLWVQSKSDSSNFEGSALLVRVTRQDSNRGCSVSVGYNISQIRMWRLYINKPQL